MSLFHLMQDDSGDGAQFDTGGVGDVIESLGDDLKDGKAVMLYGILAAVQPAVILILYLLLNRYPVWLALRWTTFIF